MADIGNCHAVLLALLHLSVCIGIFSAVKSAAYFLLALAFLNYAACMYS